MSRYIDADELYERMQDICACYEEGREVKEEALSMVYHFHTADVEEVRHGYWVQPHPSNKPFCSECKTFEQSGEKKKYCSECGAKMDKEKEEHYDR